MMLRIFPPHDEIRGAIFRIWNFFCIVFTNRNPFSNFFAARVFDVHAPIIVFGPAELFDAFDVHLDLEDKDDHLDFKFVFYL